MQQRLSRQIISRRGQASLIGLLIVMVIIMVMVWWVWLRPTGGGTAGGSATRFPGEAQTLLGRTLQKGESTQCIQNLRQLRLQIQMEKQSTGEPPRELDPKWGVPLTCPVGNLPYKYDPRTGRVWDPTPGHEAY
ncbi:MAG: hypothetical protein GX100_08490 [candidate division WS1 bacterium]|jgi:hypothetical protein|nr:hypothetical protein [candidate division WS1 bacterium]